MNQRSCDLGTRRAAYAGFLFLAVALGSVLPALAQAPAGPAEGTEAGRQLFRTRVARLLTERCLECHGGRKTKGKFDLSTRDGLLRGAKHGAALVPYDAGHSRVVRMVQHLSKPYMPPKEWLTLEQIQDLSRWIDEGAPYDAPLVAAPQR